VGVSYDAAYTIEYYVTNHMRCSMEEVIGLMCTQIYPGIWYTPKHARHLI